MKQFILILLAIVVFSPLLARHRHKKKQYKNSEIKSVSLRRTGCYGNCPSYIIQLDPDGTITYTGLRSVHDTGKYTKNVQPDVISPIVYEVDNDKVDTCRNMYRTRIPDLPGFILTIVYKDSTKTIMNADSGPGFLKQIANEIDKVGNKTDNTGWEKK